MVRSCGTDYSPFWVVKTGPPTSFVEEMGPTPSKIAEGIVGFISVINPHLFGLIVFLSTMLFLIVKKVLRIMIISHWGILSLGYIVGIYLITRILYWLRHYVDLRFDILELAYLFITVIFWILSPFVVLWSLRKQRESGDRGIFITASQKLVTFISFFWFLYCPLSGNETLYGLYLALASCILIFLGASVFVRDSGSARLTK